MNDCCWVIKVTYLKNGEVNFNEAYKTYNEAMGAIRRKINIEDMQTINEYTIKDLDSEIVYEVKCVTIY